ncbi:MAG: ABC transporter ATP-binding protein, partial [Clostridia bacterium]|nr:ABC transporter ATP-binding protein [Clostridia bacterium]
KVTGELLKRILSYIKPYLPQQILVLACIALSSAFSLYPSILTGRMIDEGLIGRDLGMLVRLIALSLALTLFSNLLGVAESWLNTYIAQHITYDMRNQLFRHLQKMSQRFFTSESQGDIITRMTSDIAGVESVISTTMSSILKNGITLVIAVVAMFRKNWLLAVIGMVVVPLFTLPTRLAGKTRWTLTRQSQERQDSINAILNETLSVSGQLLVKLFGREDYEAERYAKESEEMVRLNIREKMAGRWFFVVLSTFTTIGPLLIYLAGGILMIRYDAPLSVGDVTVMVALLGRMYNPVNSLLNIQVEWIRSMAMFTRIFAYFDMPLEIDEPREPQKTKETGGTVRFDHVHFAYSPEREILHDVSFSVPEGRSVAIVGPSGSGKSTIVSLIPRLWDVTEGSVTFDGVDVRKLALADLRSRIGIVTQETYLFSGSIRENLLYARPDATEQEMREALLQANILEFVDSQPEGLDTLVGNRGLKLSGGEKQRISIARMLLKNPELLILDEATSALDSISEEKIQQAIEPLVKARTSILIAHRLSTILAADEILVVEAGRIVERGTHESLLAHDGTYRKLYETQFLKALEDREN